MNRSKTEGIVDVSLHEEGDRAKVHYHVDCFLHGDIVERVVLFFDTVVNSAAHGCRPMMKKSEIPLLFQYNAHAREHEVGKGGVWKGPAV